MMDGHFTGILVVRNQAPTVRWTLKSVYKDLDEFHIISHGSTDGTDGIIEYAIDNFQLEDRCTFERRSQSESIKDLREELVNSVKEYAVRLEGDMAYFSGPLQNALFHASHEMTVTAESYLVRNRFDLAPKSAETNAPHPFIYHNDGTVSVDEGMEQPRSDSHRRWRLPNPVSVNCRINTPEERIRRWHRQSWHHPPSRDIPDEKTIPDHPRPYSDHMTLDEYIWKLRELEKGTFSRGWHGDSLREIGQEFLVWDVENNCRKYSGPYPPEIETAIDQYGITGIANGLGPIENISI